jgi:hypothetical protein
VHFLQSAKARTLRRRDIYAGGEEKAFQTFCSLRWSDTAGRPVCPKCGSLEAYQIAKRRKFECKAKGCRHQFSPTSQTIFASRKLAYVDLVGAICILANASKGLSALQLSRDMDVQHKTAWLLAHKVREALASETKDMTLTGTVEVDGAFFGGSIRPANLAKDRIDRRLAKHQTGKRRSVIVIRERSGRTLALVTRQEADGVEIIKRVVAPNATIHADEAAHWDALHGQFADVRRINHSVAYSLDGACTNQAESFLSRLRRMVRGQHHWVSPRYLYQYAAHAAWLEDHRRLDNGALANRALGLALRHPVSRQWKGYWQRASSPRGIAHPNG